MPALPDDDTSSRNAGSQSTALRSAQTALLRIKRYAEAAQDEFITPGEAVEQILDELEARPALGRVRQALERSFDPKPPN